jgi:type IV secretion system protein VirD4
MEVKPDETYIVYEVDFLGANTVKAEDDDILNYDDVDDPNAYA